MKAEIETVRQQGYAVDDREAETNIYCVGTTFSVPGDSAVYAFSISSPYPQLTKERYDYLVSELLKTKTIIEYQLSIQHVTNDI